MPLPFAPPVLAPSDLAEITISAEPSRPMAGGPPPAPLPRVGGRVVEVNEALILIADAFGTVRVELSAPPSRPLQVGDLVVVSGTLRPGRIARATVIEHVTPLSPPFLPQSQWAPAAETETRRLFELGIGRTLAARAALLRSLRNFFDARHFIEVDTPSLVPSPGLDVHLEAFEVEGAGYLTTSPETQMKRLLAGGIPRCFQLARCFRKGEDGGHHNREFVMLEWYRAFADVSDVIRDTEELVRTMAEEISGGTDLAVGDLTVDLAAPFERMTVAQAFERYAGIEESRALSLAEEDEDAFFKLLVDRVEPHIAKHPKPIFLMSYPASQASLARLSPTDPRVCERFELYIGGIELCNGFGELTDPIEQRQRFARDQKERARIGKPVYPMDERFIAALGEGMPRAAGNALGFDRLLALCLGATSIGDVMGFPRKWL